MVIASEQAVPQDEVNIMEKHYVDENTNRYIRGPGSILPDEQQPAALVKTSNETKKMFGIHLSNVSEKLTETGVKNLCSKYGNVKRVKMGQSYNRNNWANVFFETVGDAENACRNINENSMQMRATFYRTFDKPQPGAEENMDSSPLQKELLVKKMDYQQEEFDLELSKPTSLDSFKPKPLVTGGEFGSEVSMNILLETNEELRDIVNGRVSYRCSSDVNLHKQSEGTEQLEFVYGKGDLSELGKCKNCGNPSLTTCKGCEVFFCSTTCRKQCKSCLCVFSDQMRMSNSFSRGRGRAFEKMHPSPSSSYESDTVSIAARKLRQRQPILKYAADPCDIPSGKKLVTITTVVNHRTVFLRSMDPKDSERYYKYLNDVVEYSKTAMPLDRIPNKEDIVLALFEDVYYRALVLRVENEEALVAFLEFGNVEKARICDLKELSKDLACVNRFTFKATLSDVIDELKTDKSLTYLYNLMKKCVKLKFIQKGDASSLGAVPCELVITAWNQNLSAKINEINNILPYETVYANDLPMEPLDLKSQKVIVLDNTFASLTFVAIAKPERMTKIFLMHQRIQEYCKSNYDGEYFPTNENEICLGKVDDQWYRVKLGKSFCDGNPVMCLIDFQVYCKIHITKMRQMPEEFKFAPFSLFAQVGGVDSESELSLAGMFPILSEVAVVKVKLEDPESPTIFLENLDVAETNNTTPSMKRRQHLLKRILKSS